MTSFFNYRIDSSKIEISFLPSDDQEEIALMINSYLLANYIVSHFNTQPHFIKLDDSKPSWMTDNDYQAIVKIVDTISSSIEDKKKYSSLLEETEKNNIEAKRAKDVLLRQLEIIERTLADPDYIDKIQDYDNTFSASNYMLLRQFSEQIKTYKTTRTSINSDT